ncbi:MAG: hypothetical protein PVH89_06990 [Gammaproteobacteria bacterium]|jgi:hypothetical protein
MKRSWRVAVLLTLAAGPAAELWAEGAAKLLDCEVVRICDALGDCQPGSGQARFRMEPQELEPSGAGSYRIVYGDTDAPMQAMSEAGPFFWVVGSERDALMPSSETEWLWHQLELAAAPVATVRFLVCSLQQ